MLQLLRNSIPCSNYYEDEFPNRTPGIFVRIWLDDGPLMDFSYDGPGIIWIRCHIGSSFEVPEQGYGPLDRRPYILRVDEVHDGHFKSCSLTFLKYEDNIRSALVLSRP